ncbi:hypothetical protein MLD38_020235 [Melastoma candidum]|uniref:Uncharacterized protein n=1 Tax=Melastoma candidum TaxID=119954 RepID=A0ACB9QD79_9MYRT|nr:hypothetical protein MLD38_020235 [Melastoma candidum]
MLTMDDAARGGEHKMKRRKPGHSKKRVNSNHGGGGPKVKKIDGKMKRLFRKRAREYNSDDEDNNDDERKLGRQDGRDVSAIDDEKKLLEAGDGDSDDNSAAVSSNGSGEDDGADSEDDHGTTKFEDGSNAFRAAFTSIMKNVVTDDGLGPVLSAQRKLVAEKLAEVGVEKKVKGEAKKEKQLVKEKGHVKPANYIDAREKFLISVATKGVVKLFNAVNKAQHVQKGLNPSRSKDEKVIKKRRKEAFFSELKKPSSSSSANLTKVGTSGEDQAPAWAPLRDTYMFSNPGLKDWDKVQDASEGEGGGEMPEYKSSSEDE